MHSKCYQLEYPINGRNIVPTLFQLIDEALGTLKALKTLTTVKTTVADVVMAAESDLLDEFPALLMKALQA